MTSETTYTAAPTEELPYTPLSKLLDGIGDQEAKEIGMVGIFVRSFMDGYKNYVIYLSTFSFWIKAEENQYLDTNDQLRLPIEMQLGSFAVIVLTAFSLPILVLVGLLYAAYKATDLSRAASHLSCCAKVSGFLGATCVAIVLLIGSWSPLMVMLHWNDLDDLVTNNTISGTVVWMPIVLSSCIGLYTGVQLVEYSNTKLVLKHKMQEFGETNLEWMFPLGSERHYTSLFEQVMDFVQLVNEHIALCKGNAIKAGAEECIFDKEPIILSRRELFSRGASIEEKQEYVELAASHRICASLVGTLASSPYAVAGMVACASIQAAIPPLWMWAKHPDSFLVGTSFSQDLMWFMSTCSSFLIIVIVMSISWVRRRAFKRLLVRQVIASFLSSPDMSRRFLLNLYKETYLKNICVLAKIDEEGNRTKPVKLDEAMNITNKFMRPFEEKLAGDALSMITDSATFAAAITVEGCSVELKGKQVLDLEKYHAVWAWMKVDILLQKLRMSYWLHVIVVGAVSTIIATALNICVWRRTTALSCAAVWTCILTGQIMFKSLALAISFNRICLDDPLSLLENWRLVNKQKRKENMEALLEDSRQFSKDLTGERLVMENYFRGVNENIDQMVNEIRMNDTPMTIFGVRITTATINQASLAIVSGLATLAINFARTSSQVEDIIEDITSK